MNRKLVYTFSLVGFFLMWGVFGFIAGGPRGEPLQATMPPSENTPAVPKGTAEVGIPVTSKPEPVWTEILGFYGLIGVTALFLILALLSIANRSTPPYVQNRSQPPKESHKE